MEPITLAGAFVSIVGLLGQWKTIADSRASKDFDQYIDWLRRQEHQHLADMIVGNAELSGALRVLVEDQHDEVIAKLRTLDRTLADIASHIAGFKNIGNALGVRSRLSDQPISILRQMNEVNAKEFLELGAQYPIIDGNAYLEITEPRFINDDLLRLVEFRLLRLRHSNGGGRIFTITRTGSAVDG